MKNSWKKKAAAVALAGILAAQTAAGVWAEGMQTLQNPDDVADMPAVCLEEENSFTCTSVEEAVSVLREQVKKRATRVSIVIPQVNYQQFAQQMQEQGVSVEHAQQAVADYIEIEAFRDDGDPKWGDGAYFSLRAQGSSVFISNNAMYIDYVYSYRLTEQQEKELDAAVAQVVKELHLTEGTDYEKIRRIYKYICDNVTYDYPHYHDDSYYLQYTAYAALLHKTAVCEGYALLLYRLAKEAGLQCRIGLGGDRLWEEEDPEKDWEGHAWNLVMLDGMYYFLDATWDAGRPESEYQYFLRGSVNFANVPFHQLVMGSATHYETAIRNQLIMMEHPIAMLDYNGVGSVQDPLSMLMQQTYQKALQEAQQQLG